MKKNTLKHLITLALLAAMAGSAKQALAAPGDNWKVVGPTAGGGYIIVGLGNLNMGPLTPTTFPVHLSPNGSDFITLNAGSTATSAGQETIDIETTKNTFNNLGTVNNVYSSGYTIYLNNSGNVLNNWGTINSNYLGVYSESSGNVMNNWGTISALYPVEIDADNNTFNNFAGGVITGGTNYAFEIYGSGIQVNNAGSITGATDYAFFSEASNSVLNNFGTISSPYDPIWLDGGINFTINNWGIINSTSSEYGIYNEATNFTLNNYGIVSAATDYAVYTDSSNGTINNWGTITSPYDPIWIDGGSNNTVSNWGKITATSSDYGIYNDGDHSTINNWGAISAFDSQTIYDDASNLTINNYQGGTITSLEGEGIYIENSGNSAVNNWGTITAPDEAVEIYHSGHNVVSNWGGISSSGNDGIYIYQSSNNTINNWGAIHGELNGIEFYESSHNTINNWGQISGNQAISLESASNNTINLNGHSSVGGGLLIGGNNNVVNLNFTGLSPANIALLTAVLTPQGVNSNTSTDVSFVLRGVAYNIDPAIVNFNPSSYQLQGKNATQQAIGASLDSLAVSPAPGTPLFNLLNAIDASGNVPAALQALSPAKYALYGDLAIENSTAMVQGIDRRLNNLRDGSESVDVSSMGGDNSTVALTSGYSKDSSKDSKQIVQTAPQQNRWGFFASGDGLFYRGGSRGGSLTDGKANSVGTIVGVDGKVGDKGVLGTFFSYNNAAATLDNIGSKATIESYSGGVYGAWHNDALYLNALGAYTRNNYNSSSNTLFPGFGGSQAGSTHGNQYTANIDGGYDFHMNDRFTLAPIAGLQYVHLDVNGFNEAGNAALALGSQNVNSLQSRLGAKAAYKIATTAHSTFGAEVYAAWQHEYLDGSRGLNASFEGGGFSTPFSVQTGSPKRDAGVVGASLNFTFHDRLTLFTDYELQMWSSSNFEQTVNGGARVSF